MRSRNWSAAAAARQARPSGAQVGEGADGAAARTENATPVSMVVGVSATKYVSISTRT